MTGTVQGAEVEMALIPRLRRVLEAVQETGDARVFPITSDMVPILMAWTDHADRRPDSVAKIIRHVEDIAVPTTQLKGPGKHRKSKDIVAARWAAGAIMRMRHGMSYPAIGAALGTNHATILLAIRRMQCYSACRPMTTRMAERAKAAWDIADMACDRMNIARMDRWLGSTPELIKAIPMPISSSRALQQVCRAGKQESGDG